MHWHKLNRKLIGFTSVPVQEFFQDYTSEDFLATRRRGLRKAAKAKGVDQNNAASWRLRCLISAHVESSIATSIPLDYVHVFQRASVRMHTILIYCAHVPKQLPCKVKFSYLSLSRPVIGEKEARDG